MTIKNILVAFTGSKQSVNALKVAKIMSVKYGAHITGTLSHGLPVAMYTYGSHLPQHALDDITAADKEHRVKVRKQFFEICQDLPSDLVHFNESYGDANEQLIKIAHCYDLVIMGPANKKTGYQHMEVHPDLVVHSAGRPVIVVPEKFDVADFNENALIAWDGRRAAARAVSDGLDILKTKSRVVVLTIGPVEKATQKTAPIVQHLTRHDIAPEVIQAERNRKKISKIILQTAKDTKAGLIIMGAYQHSKLAEDLFGGVTNRILAKTNVPVLLSH